MQEGPVLLSSLEHSRKIFHTPGLSFESVTKLKAGQVSPGFVTGLFAQIYYSLHYFFFSFKTELLGEKRLGGGGRRECKRNKSVCLPAAGRCNTAAIGTTARASNYKQADSFKCRTLQGKKKKRKKKDRRQHERCLSWLVSTQSPPAFDSAQSPDSSLTLEPWQYRKAGGEGRQNTLY